MKYFTSQEDTTYFHWQIETYLRNFESVGIDLHDCHVIMVYSGQISAKAKELQSNYDANFHFYEMPDKCRQYIAAVKPYGMYRYFSENRVNESIFYHDADIIFAEPLKLERLEGGNFMSRTLQRGGMSYIDLAYLNQFEGVVKGMSEIMKVEPKEVGGGAQYVFTGLNSDYWLKVYEDCFTVFDFLQRSGTKVQVWCAEMWATLWNIWYFGEEIEIADELDFCMSRDPIDELKPIVHNAGLMGAGYFDKGNYRNSYPPYNLTVKDDMCNHVYFNEVKKIHYIRLKENKMGKIRFIKEGCVDSKTKKLYQLGEAADLGEERNNNAVKGKVAEWVEQPATEKKEVEKPTVKKAATAKKTTTSAKPKK